MSKPVAANKKNDDLIEEEAEPSFQFSDNTEEVPVTKPGLLEKRERRSRGTASRAVPSQHEEHFDIE